MPAAAAASTATTVVLLDLPALWWALGLFWAMGALFGFGLAVCLAPVADGRPACPHGAHCPYCELYKPSAPVPITITT
ncbi:hypothetical protein PG993_000837 [Apiospora rasikravindrae]|uniref:Uncharacterized protein n=1 Tax=Apiospora rasikravindrae TaxID=990691 RepID=A0ABR1UBY5_9PEZI